MVSAALVSALAVTQLGVCASANGDISAAGMSDDAGLVFSADRYGEREDSFETVGVSPYAPGRVQLVKVTSSFNAARVYWQQLDCDGYEILLKVNGKWKHAGWSASDRSNKLIKGLKKGNNYIVRVRAYNKVNGKKYFGNKSGYIRFHTKGYKQKIKGVTYIDGIMIVNKTYSLPSSYYPGGLTSETSTAFNKMRTAASYDGISLWCCSGFRSYAEQKYLYESYVRRDGKEAADRYSARPGHSEHQSGLALDVNFAGSSFDGSPEAIWLENHCSEYGFIIRYPKGKEDVTGYKYESWHVRYVGKSLAKTLTKKGLTIEEYYGITSKYKNG